MNIVCKSCNLYLCAYPFEYFNQITAIGFPLCIRCNNCIDCGNYVCSCMRCCDCWLTMEICRCDNDPHCYVNIETVRGQEQNLQIENDLINSFNQQMYITDPIDEISEHLQYTTI